MKVLVIGSGAREHAIAHALMRGGSVSEVTVAPSTISRELASRRLVRARPPRKSRVPRISPSS